MSDKLEALIARGMQLLERIDNRQILLQNGVPASSPHSDHSPAATSTSPLAAWMKYGRRGRDSRSHL